METNKIKAFLYNNQIISQTTNCPSFVSYIDEEIRKLSNAGRNGTAQNYKAAMNSFTKFIRNENFPLSSFTEEIVQKYESWLRNRYLSRNTISFYMRQLRSIYNKAVKANLTEQTFPFDNVYTGIDKTKKRAVDISVITKLIALDLSYSSSLCFARDLFLLSFYMRGMAFVDMAYLKHDNIKNGVIRYIRHKTDIMLEIKIEQCISDIINRYASKSKLGYLLPIITRTDAEKAYTQYKNKRSYYNKLLKKISQLIGPDILLTSYVSRHSWATIARNMNISLAVISAGMGHSSETMTRIYLTSLEASTIDQANSAILNHISSIHKNQ
ncbi:tyrosine-type recombinase/integrase [Bacteroides salyersiae]|uniref:tyrosine-type recombinase/integrase n=1 Tax=Bacteroides salyersiae TaxID=291644 RepID=UPI001CCC8640|nr:site-specific integrase [Bacteroides salyersiae]UBD16016.1 site-specific integrase [Bacteroides salyersiae]